MKDLFITVGSIILFIVILLLADYFIGYKWFSFIEPKKENVRREIFLNTRSYNEGKIQDLIKYRLEYFKSKGEEKKLLRSTIKHMFSEFDENKLTEELRCFLKKIKYGDVK